MTVYQTRAFGQPGQYHYKGNIINIPQDLSTIVTSLPRTPSSVEIIAVRRDGVSGHLDFKVRRSKVLNALMYLKRHHRYYSDIEIDETVLSQLPENGNVASELQYIENGGLVNVQIDGDEVT